MSRPQRGGALSASAHTPLVQLRIPAENIARARRAVALATERGLPVEEVPMMLEMLGISEDTPS